MYGSLPIFKQNARPAPINTSIIRFGVIMIAGLLFTLAIATLSRFNGENETEEYNHLITIQEANDPVEPLVQEACLTVSNIYIAKLGEIGTSYEYINSNTKMVDVFKTMTVMIAEHMKQDQHTSVYNWALDGNALLAHNPAIFLTLGKVGSHLLTMTEIDITTGVKIATCEMTLVAKYVRREVRQLTDSDREAFFSAMTTMYETDQEEGEALYGPTFKSISTLTTIHNNEAGSIECDHLHDGMAFYPSHVALTNLFELSLQSIDKSIAMPYWDYTIEGQKYSDSGSLDEAFSDSIIFDKDWFGTFHPDNDFGIMTEGRWAFLEATKVSSLSDKMRGNALSNSYGLLRSPWNMNAVPFVSRFSTNFGIAYDKAASCYDHYNLLFKDSFYDMSLGIEYAPHGSVHIQIGGVGSVDLYTPLVMGGFENETDATKLAGAAFTIHKNLYRAGILECPSTCSQVFNVPDDAKGDADKLTEIIKTWDLKMAMECKCSCPDFAEAKMTGDFSHFYSEAGSSVADVDKHDAAELEVIFGVVCNEGDEGPTMIGDHLESGSPGDPLFWPIHPTVERLLMHWYQVGGGSYDMSWADDQSTTTADDSGVCHGHNSDDSYVWAVFEGKTYTNQEIIDNTLSSLQDVDALSYVYHNFLWSHCVAAGYPADFHLDESKQDEDYDYRG